MKFGVIINRINNKDLNFTKLEDKIEVEVTKHWVDNNNAKPEDQHQLIMY